MLLFYLLIGILIYTNCFAQKDLDINIVFFELAKKSIDCTCKAILSRIYLRIFAQFKVNRVGKIEDI